MSADLKLIGATAANGHRYVGTCLDNNVAWLPLSTITAGDKSIVAAHAARGVHLAGRPMLDRFHHQVAALAAFPHHDIAVESGWNADVYALQDGRTFSAYRGHDVPNAFELRPGKNASVGTLPEWQEEVAAPLAGQPLGSFLLAASFVPILLRFMPEVPNVAIEVVGAEGIGKTTLLRAVASTYGGPGGDGCTRYWESFASGPDALPDLVAAHCDQLLILDEANALEASPDKRSFEKAYVHLGYDLGRCQTASGSLHSAGLSYRGFVLLAGNESLRDKAQRQQLPGEQIVTLTVPPNSEHGIFSKLPARFADGAAFAEALMAGTRGAHGTAVPSFLTKLCVDIREDMPGLQKRLNDWQNRFLTKVGVDRNDGKQLRMARVFAAVYAAGLLAKRYHVLPSKVLMWTATRRTYHLYKRGGPSFVPFHDRLVELVASERVMKVPEKCSVLPRREVLAGIGTLHINNRYRELRIPQNRIDEAFPDWRQIRTSGPVRDFLVGEEGKRGQDKSYARLAPGFARERLYCFRLPLL